MSRIDDILDVIDTGLQSVVPDPTHGEFEEINDAGCTRCHSTKLEEGAGICQPCREWLLGDRAADPAMAVQDYVRLYGDMSARGYIIIDEVHTWEYGQPPSGFVSPVQAWANEVEAITHSHEFTQTYVDPRRRPTFERYHLNGYGRP